ncbi:glycosyltransferase family 2 protein [Flammeovirga sp. OC4]|uniref:glycosyltransferase family 2 protein n=1 Tax=Flammeovirga sp. OC4 TaxID=1382345 RepID=UPI0005C72FFF|nr:glycosyltransferase family 2 protein [Flammeovirga sp. OC4]
MKPTSGLPYDEVAIVILNYNGRRFLEEFLDSVIQSSCDAKVIVADNASTDDSIPFLKENYPKVRLIELSENFGFTGGYNKALEQIDAKYYVLLNSDIQCPENWLTPLLTLMESDSQIAACQPKIKLFSDQESFEHAGAAGGFMDYMGYPFCRGRIMHALEYDDGQYDDTVEVFWATGACLFIRAELYHKMGGLDEKFFAHMEEIDLCWRLKSEGYKIKAVGTSEVYHVGGGTLSRENPKKTYLNFRNGLFLLFKNLPSSKLLLVLFLRMVLDGVAGVRFLLKGEVNNLWAVLKAHRDFYLSIGYLVKARRKIKNHKINFPEVYKKLIVKEFFLKKRTKFTDLNGFSNN